MNTRTQNPVTAAAVTTTPAATETFVIDADHSEVWFSLRHLLGRARGRFSRFAGEIQLDRNRPEHSSVSFEVDPASIDTRQTDRDAHLRSADFFDVETYPVIRFTSQNMTLIDDQRVRVEGTLELHGTKKSMALEVSYLGIARDPWGNERASFATEAEINRKEFGMIWNAALDNGGVILGDDVHLTIDLETIRKG